MLDVEHERQARVGGEVDEEARDRLEEGEPVLRRIAPDDTPSSGATRARSRLPSGDRRRGSLGSGGAGQERRIRRHGLPVTAHAHAHCAIVDAIAAGVDGIEHRAAILPGVETISSRQVYANSWMTVREDAIRRADGSDGIYGVVDKPTAAVIIPRDGERLHLVEQFRYPVGQRRWEFPMGTAPDRAEVAPDVLAARELEEETGLVAGRMELLGDLDIAPGMSSQREHVFLATELTAGPARREHTEQDMRARWFTTAEFEEMVRGSELVDAQSLAAYLLLLLHDRS
ncbi:MAG: hydrolase [Pseudonocardia sp.]|nr:hydrolase [Pseudonocardia sp.]